MAASASDTALKTALNAEDEKFVGEYALNASNLSTRQHYGTNDALKAAAVAAWRKAKRSTKVRNAARALEADRLEEVHGPIRTTHAEFPSVAILREHVEVKYTPAVPARIRRISFGGVGYVERVPGHDRVALYLPLHYCG